MSKVLAFSSMNRSVALVDEAPVQRRLGVEVELLKRLGRREPGEPQPAGEAAFFGGLDLDGEQVV
jgi:hypothetical protein